MTKFCILLGGELVISDRLIRQCSKRRVIAADSGIVHAAPLGVEPELWVGDFDSTSSKLDALYSHIPRQSHPVAKDATDGELAVDEAVKRGGRDFILVGGFGGQTDHVLGHIGLALKLARDGVTVFISSGNEEAWPFLSGTHEFDFSPGTRLSIFGMSDLIGLVLTGVQWPLDNCDVSLGRSLTLSNIVRDKVTLGLQNGYGVIFNYPIIR